MDGLEQLSAKGFRSEVINLLRSEIVPEGTYASEMSAVKHHIKHIVE